MKGTPVHIYVICLALQTHSINHVQSSSSLSICCAFAHSAQWLHLSASANRNAMQNSNRSILFCPIDCDALAQMGEWQGGKEGGKGGGGTVRDCVCVTFAYNTKAKAKGKSKIKGCAVAAAWRRHH